jgi:uncharacterized protein YgbK (DUF1537 family)
VSGLLLGCIADDHTGATDLANNLVRAGMRTVQVVGVPREGAAPVEADAVVVALKTRTVPPGEAVARSLEALAWLRGQGAGQIYFKVCSTFDSTPRGNIGPVAEALMDALGAPFAIATPAFPDNGRAVFKGHLFVGDLLLSESGMKDHPLTPMTDANLVRVLQAQCRRRVGLVERATVARGAAAIEARMRALEAEGVGLAIVDAIDNDDLLGLGTAVARLPLLVAGSGVAIALPANHGLHPSPDAARLPTARGAKAVVSGSCSQATNRQVAAFVAQGGAAFAVDPIAASQGFDVATAALDWAAAQLAARPDAPVLVHSTAAPEEVRAVQGALGAAAGGALVEGVLAAVARGLVARCGVGRLLVAGGETSGACVEALGIERLRIGPQIDTGVPWCHATTDAGTPLHLALKSGNFGGDDVFRRAFTLLG